MFEKIKNLLSAPQQAETGGRENERRVQIATAVILLEVAYADEEFSDNEREHIIGILRNLFDLDDESVHELIQISEQQRKKSIDLWQFTEIINSNYSDEEKYRVIETVWQVIYADRKLDKYEDYLVHKLSRVLHIPHERMIEAKLKNLPEE